MQYTQVELRNACQELHTLAEQTQLSQELISGKIDPNIYKTLLWQLFQITDVIETRYQFSDKSLQRKFKIIEDIALLPPSALFTCKTTEIYTKHLWDLNYHAFKGHIYCLYLGWMYGGQMVAKRLSLPTHHLVFDNVKTKIEYVRGNILYNLTQEDLHEAKLAFQYTIDIYKELYELPSAG